MTTKEIIQTLLASPVIAACVVGLFTVVSIWMGLRRFRFERWWERKATSYAAAIEGLHAMYDCSKAFADASLKGYELSEIFEEKLVEENLKGWAELRKGSSIGSFVMTQRATEILTKVNRRLEQQKEELPNHEFHSARCDMLSEAIAFMTIEAKKDLGTK
jgi:hypothetical protein